MSAERTRMPDALLKVLIVDDEAPARRRLRELLDDCTGAVPLRVIGEAGERARGAEPARQHAGGPRAHRHPHAGHGRHRARASPAEAALRLRCSSSPLRITSTRSRHSRCMRSITWSSRCACSACFPRSTRCRELRAAFRHQARPAALGRAPLPFGDRALARRAGADRGNRLSQGRAQVHHDPHRRTASTCSRSR